MITPFKAAHTVKSTVSQLLSSVHGVHHMSEISIQKQLLSDSKLDDSFSAYLELKPVAALVGTHKDELGIDSEGVQNKELLKKKLEEINQELKPITERFDKTLIHPPTSSARDGNRMCFFALDNKRGSECADIAPLRKILNDSFSTRYSGASLPIPRKWLLLAVILRKEFKIVPLEIVMKLSQVLEMTEEDMKFCIVYLHSIGSIMHFTDVPNDKDEHWQLKNHVICSPQVIFDSVSQLIVFSLILRDDHGDGFKICSSITEEQRQEFLTKGQISLETVEMFCSCPDVTKNLDQSAIIPAQQLILLLQYLKVASEIIHKDTNDPKKTRTTYLMPAMLDCASLDKLVNPPTPDANNPHPLHITFSFDVIPTGVFCGLITELIFRGPHKILGLTWELVEEGVKRNLVSFFVAKSNKVTLLAHDRSYEIRVVCKHKQISLHDLCTYVLSVIVYTLRKLYPKLAPQIAFRCPCPDHMTSKGVDNLCKLQKDVWVQFLCGNNPVTLTRDQQVWLGKVQSCVVNICVGVVVH